MRNLVLLTIFSIIFLSCSEQQQKPETPQEVDPESVEIKAEKSSKADKEIPPPKTLLEKMSYAQGHSTGRNTLRDSVIMDMDYFLKGYYDGLEQKFPWMEPDEIVAVKDSFSAIIQKRMDTRMQAREKQLKERGEKMKIVSDEFINDYIKKNGVVSINDSAYFMVKKKGDGPKPERKDVVEMKVVLKTPEGTEVANTDKEGQPLIVGVAELFPGWQAALTKMPVGSDWEIVVPPKFGYGEYGYADVVPPHSALILNVNLLRILPEDEAKQVMEQRMKEFQEMQRQQMQQGRQGMQGGGPPN
jgi:FKBP-type peptidyl-prolyl cis-trans isomerase FklB